MKTSTLTTPKTSPELKAAAAEWDRVKTQVPFNRVAAKAAYDNWVAVWRKTIA